MYVRCGVLRTAVSFTFIHSHYLSRLFSSAQDRVISPLTAKLAAKLVSTTLELSWRRLTDQDQSHSVKVKGMQRRRGLTKKAREK